MSWFGVAPAVLAASAVLVLPGLAIVRLLGLRGLWLWGLAAPASLSVIAVASTIAPLVGMRWSVGAVAATWVAIAGVAAVLRFILVRRVRPLNVGGTRGIFTAVGLVIGGFLMATQLMVIVGDPNNISQSFDNVFHLNAVRFVFDTGNASPWHLGRMTGESLWFYPSGWHALVALIAGISSSSIPVASNAVVLTVGAVVWPAGVVLLTRVLARGPRWLEMAAGVLAATLPAFPILPADFGVLYPYLLGVALLPSLVACIAGAIALGDLHPPAAILIVVLVGSLPGVLIAHPGAFMAFLVALMVALGFGGVRFVNTSPSRGRVTLSIGGLAAAAVLFLGVWLALRPAVEARGWGATGSLGQAAGEALFLSPHYALALPLVTVLLFLAGSFSMLARRTRRDVLALALFIVFAGLYIIAKALPWPNVRDVITGPWYNDATRLASLLPMFAIPVAAAGALVLARAVRSMWNTGWLRWRVPVALLLILSVFVHVNGLSRVVSFAAEDYRFTEASPLISADERLLLERLDEKVGENSVVAGSPWTGTSLAYAFADRHVLMPHILMDVSADGLLINAKLDEAKPGNPVCAAIEREGVGYVLDFGGQEVHGAEHDYPGFDELSSSPAVELVDREGDARLYKVVGCEEQQ